MQRVSGVMQKTPFHGGLFVGTRNTPRDLSQECASCDKLGRDYIAGSITVSMTWMTPFDWITSAMVIEAMLPCSSVSFIMSAS